MPGTVPVVDRSWYRTAGWLVAVSALLALVYFLGVSRGWIASVPPCESSLLQLAASACLLMSVVIRRRSLPVAIAVQVLSVALLIWSIGNLAESHGVGGSVS